MALAPDLSPERPWEKATNETDEKATLPSPHEGGDGPLGIAAKNARDGAVVNGSTETEQSFSVWWQEPADKDPENPLNWPPGRKWSIVGSLSFLTFLTRVTTAQIPSSLSHNSS